MHDSVPTWSLQFRVSNIFHFPNNFHYSFCFALFLFLPRDLFLLHCCRRIRLSFFSGNSDSYLFTFSWSDSFFFGAKLLDLIQVLNFAKQTTRLF